ncbi:chalcone isomerase family protein [Aquabacterium sp.]|uniref:chalcone isomerase family protein n=1 Tax=Aquabacterium sp. TaxID=1872578 RepID=UPI002487B42F|nr:chalcone isomerase family protein [Aquabacterium sp.]MDI1259327.1 chalcone isomerase family protein [Aquabacterium sp.]
MQDDLVALSPFENHRRQLMASAMAAALVPWAQPAHAASAELEGVELEETITAYGQKLVLNGAAVRKRGYFKADVTALYLPEKRTTPDAIFKLNGIRRIQLNLLREFTSSTISRIFIADFKQNSTDAEFKQLINEISQVGAAYSAVKRVSKGDVVNLDWLPGKGWMCAINGKQLMIDPGVAGGSSSHAINNELAYQIYLRMYIGPAAPEELRNGLLGLTRLPRSTGGGRDSKDKDGDA